MEDYSRPPKPYCRDPARAKAHIALVLAHSALLRSGCARTWFLFLWAIGVIEPSRGKEDLVAESVFQKEIHSQSSSATFPGCEVLKNDSGYQAG
jgi:hypothetical protein